MTPPDTLALCKLQLHNLTRHFVTNNATFTLTIFNICFFLLIAIMISLYSTSVHCDVKKDNIHRDLNTQIQSIKIKAVELNSQLRKLEERLVFPAHTQTLIFLSLKEDSNIRPQSIRLDIDNTDFINHIYLQEEIHALLSGGIQRLYTGNIIPGEHKLTATLIELLPDGTTLKTDVTYEFTKTEITKYIELVIGQNISDSKRIHITNWNQHAKTE